MNRNGNPSKQKQCVVEVGECDCELGSKQERCDVRMLECVGMVQSVVRTLRVRLRRHESTYRWIDNGTRWRGRKQSCVPVGSCVDVTIFYNLPQRLL